MREVVTIGIVFAAAIAPARASACGGFFCSTTPVQQAGEDIAYAIEPDGSLTMTVRIVYQGAAPDFAWILPVPVEPEAIEVGTDALFDALERATRPSFQTEPAVEGECRAEPRCEPRPTMGGGGCGAEDAGACSGICSGDAGASPSDGGPAPIEVRSMAHVGPYESVVLGGGTAEEVQTWLVDHGYDIPDTSLPAMREYVASGHLFVALRLRSGASIGEIQPIALRMRGVQACLPIRLTRIATVADLPIAAYFLAHAPAVPTNYSLIDPPADDPALWLGTRPWVSRVSAAVDNAGGRAFVMDYAGEMPAMPDLVLPSVGDLAAARGPATFFAALLERGYPMDTQLLQIAERFVHASTADATPAYVRCLAAAATFCGTPGAFSPAELAAAIDEAITAPRRAAQDMIDRHSTLTRLFTTMSADEMTVDPDFLVDEGVPARSNVHVATLLTECSSRFYPSSAPQSLVVPGGRRVRVREGIVIEDDDELCARAGMRVASGGCAAAHRGAGSAAAIGIALGVVVALGRRRRRRPDGARGLLGRQAGGGR